MGRFARIRSLTSSLTPGITSRWPSVVVGMATGFHYAQPDKLPELFINEVGVADACQGQGLGKRLVQALLAHARELGCVAAWVLTEEDNAAARRLYASAGGREVPGVVMSLFELE